MANKKRLLGMLAAALVFSLTAAGCATPKHVLTRDVIAEVGGAGKLPQFQYYLSTGITLNRVEQKDDGSGVERATGVGMVQTRTIRDKITFSLQTPGIHVRHSSDLRSIYIAFEKGAEIEFRLVEHRRGYEFYQMVMQSGNTISYGGHTYNVFGSQPWLLIEVRRQKTQESSSRKVEGLRVQDIRR